jgi:hypothetical protein
MSSAGQGVPADHLENALIIAALTHATAKTPAARARAWHRLDALRKQKEEQRRKGV